jgi:hypothetical protein
LIAACWLLPILLTHADLAERLLRTKACRTATDQPRRLARKAQFSNRNKFSKRLNQEGSFFTSDS